MNRPIQVRRAIWLLWALLFIHLTSSVLSILEIDSDEEQIPLWFSVTMLSVMFIPNAIAIYFANRRHNWARIGLLLFLILSVSAIPSLWSLPLGEFWLPITTDLLTTLMEIVALYWLFTGQGAAWFRHREAT